MRIVLIILMLCLWGTQQMVMAMANNSGNETKAELKTKLMPL
jgi:hypothetical protein